MKYVTTPSSFIRASIISLIILLLSYIFNYIIHVFFARTLGTVAYGNYAVVISSIQFSATFILLGADSATLRFIPHYIANEKWPEASGYLRQHLKSLIKIGLPVFTIGLIISLVVLMSYKPNIVFNELKHHPFWLFVWIIPLYSFAMFLSKLLRSINLIYLSSFLSPVISGSFIIAFLLFIQTYLVKYFHGHITSFEILLIYASTLVFLIFFQYYILILYLPKAILNADPVYLTKDWHKTGRKLMISNFAAVNLQSIVLILVEIFDKEKAGDAGVLSAIFIICSTFWLTYSAITTVLSPMISPALQKTDKTELKKLLRVGNYFTFSSAVIIYCCFILFGKELLNHFGPNFGKGYNALLITAGSYVYALRYGTSLSLLQYGGFETNLVAISLGAILIATGIGTLLIYQIGLFGAAIVIAGVQIGTTISYNKIIKEKLQIKLSLFNL